VAHSAESIKIAGNKEGKEREKSEESERDRKLDKRSYSVEIWFDSVDEL
jgi:hypothetical protein